MSNCDEHNSPDVYAVGPVLRQLREQAWLSLCEPAKLT